MADEKLKIRIVPEYLPHYIGEVEIDCLPLNEIKTQAEMLVVIQKLKSLLIKVKGAGFMQAVCPDGELLKKINTADFIFMDYENGEAKLNKDEKYKQLTDWFCESLELTISTCNDMIEHLSKDKIPDWIQYLINKGLVLPDGKTSIAKNIDALVYGIMEQGIVVTENHLDFFVQSNGKPYSHSTKKQALPICKNPEKKD